MILISLFFLTGVAFIIWRVIIALDNAFPKIRGKRICLLIAHPDDEAMFFAPTLISLTKPELKNQVKVLCFSTGNADNLGATRRKELTVSALLLGVRSQSDVTCLDDQEHFPDSQHVTWNPRLVANTLTAQLAPSLANTPVTQAPPIDIDLLITFDQQGVSDHANHKALHEGARSWLRALSQRYNPTGGSFPVSLYTLTSVSWARKYSSVLDVVTTALHWASSGRRNRHRSREGRKVVEKLGPRELVFVSGFAGYRRAQRAMVHAHQSQMRWFRWGWIGISRYMVLNALVREDVQN